MPKVCDVKEVPVGGVYRSYDPRKQEPDGPEVTVLSKGVHNRIGYNVIHRRAEKRGSTERIGDHCTNIAEDVIYVCCKRIVRHRWAV